MYFQIKSEEMFKLVWSSNNVWSLSRAFIFGDAFNDPYKHFYQTRRWDYDKLSSFFVVV